MKKQTLEVSNIPEVDKAKGQNKEKVLSYQTFISFTLKNKDRVWLNLFHYNQNVLEGIKTIDENNYRSFSMQ